MEEEWRDVVSYEDIYQISNFGKVRSLSRKIVYPNGAIHPYRERILQVYITPNGYPSVVLGKDGVNTRFSVHRLVAQAFIPNPDDLPQVNHIDGDKTNNRVDNLEWCTEKENYWHSVKILKKHIKPIRCRETGKSFSSIKSAALYIKKDPSSLAKSVKSGKTCGGFHWVYI